jgi:hypothetical protein
MRGVQVLEDLRGLVVLEGPLEHPVCGKSSQELVLSDGLISLAIFSGSSFLCIAS